MKKKSIPPLSREEKKKKRRDDILKAATPFFARWCYWKADLDKLAQIVGVGKGTIYRYFPTKEKLFLATVDRGMVLLKQSIDKRVEEVDQLQKPLDMIRAAVLAYLAFFDKHPEYVELFMQERAIFRDRDQPTYFEHRDANMGRWKDLLGQLMDRGEVRPLDIDATLDVMADLLYGTIFSNYFARRQVDSQEQAERILDLIFYGLLPKEREK